MPSPRRIASNLVVLPPANGASRARRAVLEAALALFAKQTYGGTSVREIAAAARVQTATLYAHFPSKEALLAEVVTIGHQEHHRSLQEACEASSADPIERMTALVRAHVLMHAHYAMLAVVANAESHALSAEAARESQEIRQRSEQLFHTTLEKGVESGQFDVPDNWLAVAAIAAMGMRVAHWYNPDAEPTPDQIADTYVQFALRLLRAAGESSTERSTGGKRA